MVEPMNNLFFANVMDDSPIPGFGGMSAAMKEYLILLAALFLVTALSLGWAYYTRRDRRRAKRRADRRLPRRSIALDAARGVAEIAALVKERQEGRRRIHRPRNPTLAETGGLPPIRKDVQSPPNSPS